MTITSKTHAQNGVTYRVTIVREEDPVRVRLKWKILSIDGEEINEEEVSEDS